MFLSFTRICAAIGLVLLASVAAAQAASYKITAPLKGKNRPDLPCCQFINLFGPPSISGDFVVYTSRNGPADGIWSYEISTKKMRKLAGFGTKVPGGKGKFTQFGHATSPFPTTVGGETVAFFGWDKDNAHGVYTVNVRGGPVTRIATTKTAMPGGGARIFKDIRHASTNGVTVAFYGLSPDSATGIFRANVDGTGLATVIDATDTELDARTANGVNEDYFGLYTTPTVGKKDIQFYASGLFDPVSGSNAVFRARGGFVDLADNLTRPEGSAKGAHVRIGATSAAVGTGEMAFHADTPADGFAGLFKVTDVDFAAAYATTKARVPGFTGRFGTFYGFALDKSGLAFTASFTDDVGSLRQDVFFVGEPGGKIVKIASGKVYYLPYVGDRSVSKGRIVFAEGTNFADTFFLATPKE